MKVLHVIPSISERSGGPGQAIVPMCLALQNRGLDVQIVTTDAGLPTQNGLPGNAELPIEVSRNVPIRVFPVQWGKAFKYSRPLTTWLGTHVGEFDVVHIHAVFNHACIAAARACRRQKVPYIVRPLGTLDPWSMKQKSFRKQFFWQIVGQKMIQEAAAVQYTAEEEQKAAEESLKLNHGVVVPLGVESSLFSNSVNDNEFRRTFPSIANNPYVLVLSRLHPKKGLDILLDAFISLHKQAEFANWRLVLAGDGPRDHVRELQQRAAASLAEAAVLFPGWLDGALKISALQDAALLALPSHHENFGLCIVEALACGIPVLVSPHVNLAPKIEAADAGWVVPVDAGEIQKVLSAILADDVERSRRGRAGKQLARQFEWPEIALTLQNLYCELTA